MTENVENWSPCSSLRMRGNRWPMSRAASRASGAVAVMFVKATAKESSRLLRSIPLKTPHRPIRTGWIENPRELLPFLIDPGNLGLKLGFKSAIGILDREIDIENVAWLTVERAGSG